uniref:Uncharacterized protein n=1 Tax=Oryza sativa subsp. japonica TaxID=39947 RepID=Q2R228_ORYSJ|nr:hypothetical protein LOC_Os11g37220 [Oryza sativa Japonica Group]
MKCSRVRLVLVMVSLQAMIAMLPDGAGAQNGDGSRCSKRCSLRFNANTTAIGY